MFESVRQSSRGFKVTDNVYINMFYKNQECSIVFVVICNKIFFLIEIFSLWTKNADYIVNLSWGTEGSKSASASTGGNRPPSAFTTFINSPEGDSFR